MIDCRKRRFRSYWFVFPLYLTARSTTRVPSDSFLSLLLWIKFFHNPRHFGQLWEVNAPSSQTLGIRQEMSVVPIGTVGQHEEKLCVSTPIIGKALDKYRQPDLPVGQGTSVNPCSPSCPFLYYYKEGATSSIFLKKKSLKSESRYFRFP